jgi:hypothetical protein
MNLLYSEPQPVYAYADGIVTYIHDDIQASIRYGSNYMVRYYHLSDLQVSKGDKIHTGDLLGYTETMPDGEFWEISVAQVVNDGEWAVSLPPIDFFDEKSKRFLRELTDAGTYWTEPMDENPGTSASTKGYSWIDEIGAPRFFDDMDKFAYSSSFSFQDWIDYREEQTGHDLEWFHDYVTDQWENN